MWFWASFSQLFPVLVTVQVDPAGTGVLRQFVDLAHSRLEPGTAHPQLLFFSSTGIEIQAIRPVINSHPARSAGYHFFLSSYQPGVPHARWLSVASHAQ